MKVLTLACVVALIAVLAFAWQKTQRPVSALAVIEAKGIPAVAISSFEIADKGDGFKLLTIYGVNEDPAAVVRKGEAMKDHWLLFTADADFIRQVKVHFETMKNPSIYHGSTLFASLNSRGSKFQLVQISSKGEVGQTVDALANMVKLEVGDKGHEIRLKPQPRQ